MVLVWVKLRQILDPEYLDSSHCRLLLIALLVNLSPIAHPALPLKTIHCVSCGYLNCSFDVAKRQGERERERERERELDGAFHFGRKVR